MFANKDLNACEKSEKIDGIEICSDNVSLGYIFTCKYSLEDQVIDQNFNVDTSIGFEAHGEGQINYSLLVGDNEETGNNVFMGQTVNFKIRPKTEGIVYATVKSCSITFE